MVTQTKFPSWHISRLLILCCLAGNIATAQQPPMRNQQGGAPIALSMITVKVLAPDGTPYGGMAAVTLSNFGGGSAGVGSARSGEVQFRDLLIGRYTVDVVAPGYRKTSETVDVSIPGQNQYAYITLVPESSDAPGTPSSAGPVLAPNAQKDLNKALDAIRQQKPNDARKYLDKLSRSAPGNPDVNYLWGVYYSANNDWKQAKSYWEKAIQIYPQHAFSLAGLAQIAVHNGDLTSAIGYLSKAAESEPSSWRYEEQLANAYLEHKDYEKAQTHAEHAVELGKDRAAGAKLILARAVAHRGDKQRAIRILQAFLETQPKDSRVPIAQQMLDSLRKSESVAVASAVSATPVPPPLELPSATTPAASIASDLAPPPKWMPPDVDESMPAIEPGVACPLQQVQDEAAKRVHDFIDSVNKITATEKLNNELLDRAGFPSVRESRSFNYVVGIQEVRKGMMDVEEYRDGAMDPGLFPQGIATVGLPSLVLIFHPSYRDDFEVRCEGLSRWGGGLAWQVHFRQQPDKPSRLRGYRVGGIMTPVALRGRAWIAADTYQVVRLETDLVSPLPEIRLKAEHISVDYGPVAFRKENTKLWLPQTAELYFDFKGRRMHRRHDFSNYLLFAVDEKEKISAPKMPVDADTAAAPASSSPNNF